MTPELQALLDRLLNPSTATGGPVTDAELAALVDGDLALLRAGIGTAAEELADTERTAENVAGIQAAADANDRIADLQDQRASEAEARDEAAREALDRLEGRRTQGSTAEEDASASTDPEPVAASGRRAPIGAMGRRRAATSTSDRPAAPPRHRSSTPLVAAGSVPGHAMGTPYIDMHDLADAVNERMRTLGQARGAQGEQVIVASARRQYPDDRLLRNGDAAGNTRRLDAVTDPQAVVAAGGFCAPAEVDYTVEVLGVTDRPVRDALPSFGADKGRLLFRRNIAFADYAGAVGLWTEQDDIAAADPDAVDPPTKPCLDIECPAVEEAQVDAVTLCLNFRNMTSRFDSEGTAAAIRAGDVAYARYAENRLLAKMRALCVDQTAPATGLGGLRDLFASLDKLIAYRNSRWRVRGTRLRAIFPAWIVQLIALDQARGLHGGAVELLSVTEEMVTGWLTRRGVAPIYHLDGMPAQVSAAGVPAVTQQFYGPLTDAGTVPEFPDVASILLYDEGDFSYLDGGTLDLGVVRDQASMANNSYKTFMEEFNGVAFRGQEAIHLAATIEPRGGQAGTVDLSLLSD